MTTGQRKLFSIVHLQMTALKHSHYQTVFQFPFTFINNVVCVSLRPYMSLNSDNTKSPAIKMTQHAMTSLMEDKRFLKFIFFNNPKEFEDCPGFQYLY